MRKKRLCAGCRNPLPAPFLDLGEFPPAHSYTQPCASETEELRAPLAIAFCPACYLVQLTHIVPPQQMLLSHPYFSPFAESYHRHTKTMADELCGRFQLGRQSTVVEIGGRDGYLLQYLLQRNVRVLGIDPAESEAAGRGGIPTRTRFFKPDLLPELEQEDGKVDLIIGNNVLAHLPGINALLSAVHGALGSNGHAVFEIPYVLDLLERNEYDTIYHQQVYYYSLSALKRLVERACLHLVDVSHEKVHGGTLRVCLAKYAAAQPSAAVEAMLLAERAAGLLTPERYSLLRSAVEKQKAEFTGLLRRLRGVPKTVAAYGAPATGNTLLNACGIDNRLIDFTVDENEHKQGLLLPGSRIPILAPEALLERQPDYAVVLQWHLAAEIMQQQAEYVRRGGRFILPIPSPRILGADELPEAA